MVTNRFIQKELAEFRRMIKQDIREELRAALKCQSFCPKGAGDVAARQDYAHHQEDVSIKCAASSLCFSDDEPLSDRHPVHSSVPGQLCEHEQETTDSCQVLDLTEAPTPKTKRNSTHTTLTGMDKQKSLADEVTGRWGLLASGVLERLSVVHEFWIAGASSFEVSSVEGVFSSVIPTLSITADGPDLVDTPVAWWIVDPFSTRRFFWDLLGIVLCTYDLIMVPIQTAFVLHESYAPFRNVNQVFSTCFWTLDILISFVTGQPDKDGLVEVRPSKIARKYMATWFVHDLAIAAIDWVIFFWNAFDVSRSMRVGKAITRVLRASRLLRIFRIAEKVGDFLGTVGSELVFTIVTVMKQIVVLLLICHYIACAWYSIGTAFDDSSSWPSVFLSINDTVLYAYASSLHFSLTQFTFGYADLTPQTALELFFVNTVLIVALLAFSIFTSTVSRAIAHLEQVNSFQLAEEVKVRQFCSESHIPRKLMARVRNFMRQRARSYNYRMISENDIEVFHALPKSIVRELREHRFMRHLVLHPLFDQCFTVQPKPLRELCWFGIEEKFLLPGQECFPNGLDINRMIFLLTGKLSYRLSEDNKLARDAVVLPGLWACEETLWSKKSCLFAPFIASEGSQLMLLIPKMLREIASRDILLYNVIQGYAKLFIERFNEASCDEMDNRVLFNDPVALKGVVREAWKRYSKRQSGGDADFLD